MTPMTIIYFTRYFPNALADELSRQGHTVHEVLAISEVLALAEQHPEAQIVIAPDVDDERARVVGLRYATIRLQTEVTAPEIIFELSHFTKGTSLQ